MKKIHVELGERSYDIRVGAGQVRELARALKSAGFKGPVVLVTDKVVSAKTAKTVDPALKYISNDLFRLMVPASERSKSLEVFRDTVQKISKRTRTFKPFIIALGGGVVGDLAGFIAATYRRGIPFIQVPTTLLAQVDSSVGGKVGIDLPEAKNLIGSFWQPEEVIIDTDFLRTLPKRQLRNGLAEVIKCAVISGGGFFEFLEKKMSDILALDKGVLEKVIYECVSIKARIVEKDERDDKGIRIALNLGHTLGHAIEAAAGYSSRYNHGESIAVGTILACEIAMRLDMLEEPDFLRVKSLIKKAGLPVSIRGLTVKDIMNSHRYDKKFITGSNRFVLPRGIGHIEVVDDIPWLLVKTVLKQYVK